MADQYGLTPQDYIYDLKRLSYRHYSQGMLFFIVLFLKQQLKPTQVIIATLMLYDVIYHIPKQVSLSIVKDYSTYLFFPRFSTSTSMFSI